MKEGIGYTLTLNIAIVFIVIIFTFLSNIVIYYKGYKVSNMITSSIEKYEGFNKLSYKDIERNLTSIGYNKSKISCGETMYGHHAVVKIQGYRCILPLTIDLDEETNNAIIKFSNDWLEGYRNHSILSNDAKGDSPNWLASVGNGQTGYCVYKCMFEKSDKGYKNHSSLKDNEYFYIVKTNMFANIPILNSILNYSIYTDTNVMYDFENALGTE